MKLTDFVANIPEDVWAVFEPILPPVVWKDVGCKPKSNRACLRLWARWLAPPTSTTASRPAPCSTRWSSSRHRHFGRRPSRTSATCRGRAATGSMATGRARRGAAGFRVEALRRGWRQPGVGRIRCAVVRGGALPCVAVPVLAAGAAVGPVLAALPGLGPTRRLHDLHPA